MSYDGEYSHMPVPAAHRFALLYATALLGIISAPLMAGTQALPKAMPSPPPEDDAPAPSLSPPASSGNEMPRIDMMPKPTVASVADVPAGTITALIKRTAAFSTLSAAVSVSGLEETLSAPGVLTVFAPTNDAFEKLPADARTALMNPANKIVLTRVLSHHVLVGQLKGADIAARIKSGGGRTTLTMLTGEPVTAEMAGTSIILTDTSGNRARITQSDKTQSNGVVHIIDSLIMPQPRKNGR
jgi:uncharacterized surface protein with fasciclin (FAS1) repeats